MTSDAIQKHGRGRRRKSKEEETTLKLHENERVSEKAKVWAIAVVCSWDIVRTQQGSER